MQSCLSSVTQYSRLSQEAAPIAPRRSSHPPVVRLLFASVLALSFPILTALLDGLSKVSYVWPTISSRWNQTSSAHRVRYKHRPVWPRHCTKGLVSYQTYVFRRRQCPLPTPFLHLERRSRVLRIEATYSRSQSLPHNSRPLESPLRWLSRAPSSKGTTGRIVRRTSCLSLPATTRVPSRRTMLRPLTLSDWR